MARGGKREGAGRKKSKLPPELQAALGPAPLGQPLKLARWFTDAIAILTQLVMEGEPYSEMLATVRASAGAAGRVIPTDIIFEANRLLSADAKDVAKNAGGAQAVARDVKATNVESSSAGASRRDPT
jgi:hypothetical protein